MQIKLYHGGGETTVEPPIETGPPDDAAPEVLINEKGETGNGDPIMQISPSAAESVTNPAADSYYLQVASVSDQMSAIGSIERLKQMGHQAHIAETDVDGKIWYRVQIGGFPDRVAAQMARDTLTGQGFTDTLIIKNGQ